ncbi:hypothetical protein [Phenylobacterium sp.]|jgi:hypothetical protein|uniref:hypothetical protein n=1 Tax=Phenylobacterium sp. TaxID=1871053 RepID=UPI0017E5A496|nr:hypothetical protein [Phenylobacterium sp.]MBA4794023.1 hypothetical protein [Phenylobacterium sp.]
MASLSKTPAAARPTLLVLGAASLIIGLLKTAKPEAIARNTGMAEAGMVRTLGLRETAAGAGLLLAGPNAPWLAAHGLGLLGQIAVLLKARPATSRQWRGLALGYGVLLGLTLADLYAARRLARARS